MKWLMCVSIIVVILANSAFGGNWHKRYDYDSSNEDDSGEMEQPWNQNHGEHDHDFHHHDHQDDDSNESHDHSDHHIHHGDDSNESHDHSHHHIHHGDDSNEGHEHSHHHIHHGDNNNEGHEHSHHHIHHGHDNNEGHEHSHHHIHHDESDESHKHRPHSPQNEGSVFEQGQTDLSGGQSGRDQQVQTDGQGQLDIREETPNQASGQGRSVDQTNQSQSKQFERQPDQQSGVQPNRDQQVQSELAGQGQIGQRGQNRPNQVLEQGQSVDQTDQSQLGQFGRQPDLSAGPNRDQQVQSESELNGQGQFGQRGQNRPDQVLEQGQSVDQTRSVQDVSRQNQGNAVADCIRNCPVTVEFNPVCGTNNVTYNNPGRLECARLCGVEVSLLRTSACRFPVPAPNATPLTADFVPSSATSAASAAASSRNLDITPGSNGVNNIDVINPSLKSIDFAVDGTPISTTPGASQSNGVNANTESNRSSDSVQISNLSDNSVSSSGVTTQRNSDVNSESTLQAKISKVFPGSSL